MKKIKIKINYYQLQQLNQVVEVAIAELISNQLNTEAKTNLDILMGIRLYLRKKLVTKEVFSGNIDKFKLEFRYFEAVKILQLIASPDYFDIYTDIETQILGVTYFVNNKIILQ